MQCHQEIAADLEAVLRAAPETFKAGANGNEALREGIDHAGKGRIGLGQDRRVMELMPAQPRPRRMGGHGNQRFGQAVAQMHPPLLETRLQPQQPRHLVPRAIGRDQPRAHRGNAG